MDIVTAYKSLKQAVAKSGTTPYTASSREASVGRKGYLKMTIAAQQHSKQRMNQELLVYQLQASKKCIISPSIEHNRPVHTAEGSSRRDVAIYQAGSLVPMMSSIPGAALPP